MRELRSFGVADGIKIQCIPLQQNDSADLVFSSVEDRDMAREHPRRLNISDARGARMPEEQWGPVKCSATINGMSNQPAS
jgi:hypothetical protein